MDFPNILHRGTALVVLSYCYKLFMDPASSLLIAAYSKAQKPLVDGKAGVGRDTIELPLDGVALVATQVHMDCAGRIPCLLVAGFRGLAVAQQVRTIEAFIREMSEAAQVRVL